MNWLKYIFAMILLTAAIKVAGQSYVIDEVCVGVERYYRIDGENGSTYSWMLTDTAGVEIPLTDPGTTLNETDSIGNPITISEIAISWITPGTFTLSATQFSAFGCDTILQGAVFVFEQPFAFAGNQQTICPGDSIHINEATAEYYSQLKWTGGDGSFNNDTILQPIYTPGPNDILAGSTSLTLTADGLGNNATCNPAISVVDIILVKQEALTSTRDTTICSSELPFTWEAKSYAASTVDTISLISTTGCDSIAILNLVIIPETFSSTDTVICENELPFSWNGNDYLTTNIYNDTIPNFAGCDSIMTLNLTVVPNSSSILDTTICETEIPLIWNGNDYNLTGTYHDTITNIAGCDSIMTLNLSVIEQFVHNTDTTICENGLPFSWRGVNYFVPTIQSDTLPGAAGCDSIMNLNLTVLFNTTSTLDTTICETELPFSWNGNNYSTTDTYIDTIPSIAGCDSIMTLNLIVFPSSSSILDTTICETEIPLIWNGNDYNLTGTYHDTITNIAGCDSIMTLNLTVIEQFVQITDTIVCETDLPFVWDGTDFFTSNTIFDTIPNIAGCDSIMILNLMVTPQTTDTIQATICDTQIPYSWGSHIINNAGTFTETFTSIAGCDSTITLELDIAPQIIDTVHTQICSDQLPYLWNSLTINSAGLYTETMGSANGCDSVITLDLDVAPQIADTISLQVCTAQLPYNWQSYSIDASGFYTETLTSMAGCDSIITLAITVAEQIVDTIYAEICEAQVPYSWGGHLIVTDGLYNDTLINVSGCDSIVTLNAVILPKIETFETINICEDELPFTWNGQSISSAGNYIANLTSFTNCDSTVTLTLNVNKFYLSASKENIDCKGDNSGWINLSVSEGSGSYSYNWSNGQTTQNIFNLTAGSYTVIVSDLISGCSNQLTVSLSEPNIADNENPSFVAPADFESECISSWPDAFQNLFQFRAAGGQASDNYQLDESSFALINVDTLRVGNRLTLERSYRISDICNNTTTVIHRLVSTDDTPPIANCNFITISINVDGTYKLTQANIDSIAKGTFDNCTPYDQLKINVTPSTFDCSQVGEMVEYTLTVTDQNGNQSSCTNGIMVADNFVPQITCKDTTLYLNVNGELHITNPSELLSTLIENCGIDSIFIDKTQFTCTDIGINPVTISVRDVNGLMSMPCIANVTVLDSIPPVVIAQNIEIYLDDSEETAITPNQIDNGSYDACGIAQITLDKLDFTCADVGDNVVTLTVTDINGNTNTGTAMVTVIPLNEKPFAEDDLVETIQNIPVSFYLPDNDIDPDGFLAINSLTIYIQPQHGSLSPGVNDSLIYTPDPMYIGDDVFSYIICDDGIPCITLCDTAEVTIHVYPPNTTPVAVNDQYASGCYTITGLLTENDFDPDGHDILINTTPVTQPIYGSVSLFADGSFTYEFEPPLAILDSFKYEICDVNFDPKCDLATVYITIFLDNDCDGIDDVIDIDDDNDGILDFVEGDLSIDTDNDGIPDSLDIDSDNDGIPDNTEAQSKNNYLTPSGFDDNQNGLDDIYENGMLGIQPVDTDNDGIPDYIDSDSDDDGVHDYIEGFDIGAKGIAEVQPIGGDDDGDGLDNAYDNFFGSFNANNLDNPYGANPHLQDFDGDGIPDWRDPDDDNDDVLTKYEDLNNNGIFYDDDLDFDGHPEYLDYRGDCTMFIPEGFSPDGDGIHDHFQIYCIDKYPNAKMMIFDREGNKIFEKEHYGNLDYWGSHNNAWWSGETNRNTQGKVEPDVYLYILDKGSGSLERGVVMVSY